MRRIHFCGAVLVLAAAAAAYPAQAQRCVVGLDANGNPNGDCINSTSGGHDSGSYFRPK